MPSPIEAKSSKTTTEITGEDSKLLMDSIKQLESTLEGLVALDPKAVEKAPQGQENGTSSLTASNPQAPEQGVLEREAGNQESQQSEKVSWVNRVAPGRSNQQPTPSPNTTNTTDKVSQTR